MRLSPNVTTTAGHNGCRAAGNSNSDIRSPAYCLGFGGVWRENDYGDVTWVTKKSVANLLGRAAAADVPPVRAASASRALSVGAAYLIIPGNGVASRRVVRMLSASPLWAGGGFWRYSRAAHVGSPSSFWFRPVLRSSRGRPLNAPAAFIRGVAEHLALGVYSSGLGPDSHHSHPHQEKNLPALRGENQSSSLSVSLLRLSIPEGLNRTSRPRLIGTEAINRQCATPIRHVFPFS